MELEGFKSVWQKRPMEGHSLSSPDHVSPPLQFLRASSIRDLQRSDEVLRFIFCFLFAMVVIAASFLMMLPGVGRIAAWLFAAALLVDGLTSMACLVRRCRAPATATILEFISGEYRQIETRMRVERYSQPLFFILALIALLLSVFGSRPIASREGALDVLGRMAVVTAFLAFAWRRARSRSRDIGRELERYLKDLSVQ